MPNLEKNDAERSLLYDINPAPIIDEAIIAVRLKPKNVKDKIRREIAYYLFHSYERLFLKEGRDIKNPHDREYFERLVWYPGGFLLEHVWI